MFLFCDLRPKGRASETKLIKNRKKFEKQFDKLKFGDILDDVLRSLFDQGAANRLIRKIHKIFKQKNGTRRVQKKNKKE